MICLGSDGQSTQGMGGNYRPVQPLNGRYSLVLGTSFSRRMAEFGYPFNDKKQLADFWIDRLNI